jgi:hypothetical protein
MFEKMDKKDWIITIIIIILVVFVILFWDKFIIKNEEIINADYCKVNEDCVWAVNPNNCCVVPIPINKNVVKSDGDYILYQEGVDYSKDYPKKEQCFSEDGKSLIAGCAPMVLDDYKQPLVCVNSKCVSI